MKLSDHRQTFKKYCCFFFCFFFLTRLSSYSQTNKVSTPLFILQGTVKLKGKPIDGVSLELTKNAKQITKIISRKNGMYAFEMNKSNSDLNNEYLLTIIKEGAVSGTLRINTYTPEKESDYVPYIFNLDINLVLSTVSDISLHHDFGKIKWDPQLGIFDFDKEVELTIEKNKESLKNDSSKNITEMADKMTKDSLFTSTSISAKSIANNEEKEVKQKSEEAKQNSETPEIDSLAIKENIHQHLSKSSADKNELAISNEEKTTSKKGSSNIIGDEEKTANLKKGTDVLKNKKDESINLKTIEKRKLHDLKEKKESTSNKKEWAAAIDTRTINNKKNTAYTPIDKSIEKSQQLTTNLYSTNIEQQSFDAVNIFSLNNDKMNLLKDKDKMERQKAVNLAKKYETNNILTSLLDVVEEYDKK